MTVEAGEGRGGKFVAFSHRSGGELSWHSLVGNREAQNEVCGLLARTLLSLMDGRRANLGTQSSLNKAVMIYWRRSGEHRLTMWLSSFPPPGSGLKQMQATSKAPW